MRDKQKVISIFLFLLALAACAKNPETSNTPAAGQPYSPQNGQQPSQQANTSGNPNSGAGQSASSSQGETTDLVVAASEGNTILVTALIDSGAEVNSQNESGMTALMVAAMNGHVETVKVLLAQGADVDIKDNNGHTAFSYATSKGHQVIAELLKAAEER